MAKTILVVDDDRLIRRSLDLYLSNAGCTVIQAENGQQGLETALEHHPDMIISDMKMPKLTGAEMVAEIRKDEWGKSVPVVIMSTIDDVEAVNNALQAGITTYLSKSSMTPDAIAAQVLSSLQ